MKKWLDKYEAPKAQVGTMLAPITGEDVRKFFDMFSVPQKAVTKLVTGKYQTPSEAMDIKNPVGAFVTDMILDPINLMGAGIAGKAAKASTKSGALSKAYKYNPWAFKANPEAGYRMIGGKEGYLDALTSGQIRPTGVYEHAHFNIGQPLNPNRLSAEELIQAGSPGGYKGPYMAEMQQGTWQRMSDAFSNSPEMQEQFRLLGKDKDVWQHPLFGHIKVDDPRLKLYKEHWLKGYKEVPRTKKKAQNGIEGTMGGLTDIGFNYNGAWGGTMQMGGSLPGAVGFTYARTAGAAPSNGPYAKKTKASAQNGKEMKFYQEGLDFKPKTISQDGTVIDPMGYWNPKNVGNPVIIPSTDITMQGVDQPLIGISDTGDVQYMQPGEDYAFDGDYVTEIPVMQQGGRTPLYVSDPNDPRLKTYQDSLYSYNTGQRMAGILKNDKNLIKIIPKSIIYKNMQAALKKHGNQLLDNSSYASGGYENYEKLGSIMKEYQSKGNKGILPIKYQPYWPNPDNEIIDLVTLRGFWDATGLTKKLGGQPRPPGSATLPEWKKPEQEVILDPSKAPKKKKPKPQSKASTLYVEDPKDPRLKRYQDNLALAFYEKPKQPVEYKKPQPKQDVVKKQEPVIPIVERRQNVYEGTPVYSPGAGSGLGSTLIGFMGPKGDTTYIKPEDYERFAVPKYGKQYIEGIKKQRNGGVSVNMADQYPIEKLDQSLNFTNYNKPTKGGWLDKYN